MWPLDPVHSAIVAGLGRAAATVEAEQAVRGIDALTELALHGVLADALESARFLVQREVRYPLDRGKRRRSEGRRCDLVVPRNARRLDLGPAQLDLFDAPSPCSLDDALWVEVKVVAQFAEGRPNRGYAAELQGPIWRDLEKLARDPAIVHAAQLVLLFTADAAVAEHDLAVTLGRARARGLQLDEPRVAGFTVGDRIGNARCTVLLVGILR